MARVTQAEIEKYLPEVARLLEGMIFGEVVIDVRGGHIANVKRSRVEYGVQNGRVVGGHD